MKVSTIYHQGSSFHREDGYGIISDLIFFVLDGVSEPYGPQKPQRLIGELSGGELVSRLTENWIGWNKTDDLPLLAKKLNKYIKRCLDNADFVPSPGKLPGATFVITKINQETVEILQAGDCFALWETTDGNIQVTTNQVRAHDVKMNDLILDIQRREAAECFGVDLEKATPDEHRTIRGAMWNRFCPILEEAREMDVNNPENPQGYGLLNGQPELEKMWFYTTMPLKSVKTILLFSDGMVPWNLMKDKTDEKVAQIVLDIYRRGGLAKMLLWARGIEEQVKGVNYIDNAEATAIAIEF
ncbi:MAG: hypothetical protein US98_C0060G0001 [Parcubacteria group bacterium GW2011_GWC1_38_6]|nr:MAG: hypothetical protein US98_C0060G0001 [Parcubacteria group bacterium GW2011_GWC1_38_6]